MSDDEFFECFNKHQKEFLVSVTVHKARNLNVFNADTFVTITFNGDTRKTKTFQCSDCPYYNEYFVFEIHSSLDDLMRKNIRMVVNQTHVLRKGSAIGELNVNLSTIWKQKCNERFTLINRAILKSCNCRSHVR